MSEALIKKRMSRFQLLLEHAKFDFKQYQYDGVEWCIRNELRGQAISVSGGFIADEMGLGKTLTMIGTMFCNYLNKTLIVVPPALIKQWSSQLFHISGHRACIFHGSKKPDNTLLVKAPIVLTTYGILLTDDCILKKIMWDRVIFDEAHHLRNNNTGRFRNCQLINARIRWLVTGTPVQNKKKDFYNLCTVAAIPASIYKDTNAEVRNKFILRRTKADVGIG